MRTEDADVVTRPGTAVVAGDEGHTHPEKRSWPWLVAAFVLCPCHLPIVLAVLGTGAFGGLIARSQGVLFVVLAAAFGFALWRYLAQPKAVETCPACRAEQR